eukprot:355924-Chlamydomonas_euryale.AAC.3
MHPQAAKVSPKDVELRKKLAECEKTVKRQKFEEALAVPDEEVIPVSSTIVLESMTVEDGYKGPRMKGEWTWCMAECAEAHDKSE